MPRFFFDVVDGTLVTDDELGLEFANLGAAITEAAQGARDLVAHGIMTNEDVSGQAFQIRDENGQIVATLSFRECLPRRLRS
jgi:hypothetical protein